MAIFTLPSKATGAFYQINDIYSASAPTIVTLKCFDNKNNPKAAKTIRGILCSDLKFNIVSSWANAMGVSVASVGSQFLDATDALTQFTIGTTIRQPWMSRKVYQTTSPISLSVTIRFMAETDGYKEVYQPIVALMSLLYPRLAGTFGGSGEDKGLASVLSTYIIPGPSLFYNGKGTSSGNENPGDVVQITIGNMVTYSMCYLEQLDISIPNIWNAAGYPHYAEAVIKFTVMDSLYRKPDGSFTPFQDAPFDPAIADALIEMSKKTGEIALKGFKAVVGLLTPGV